MGEDEQRFFNMSHPNTVNLLIQLGYTIRRLMLLHHMIIYSYVNQPYGGYFHKLCKQERVQGRGGIPLIYGIITFMKNRQRRRLLQFLLAYLIGSISIKQKDKLKVYIKQNIVIFNRHTLNGFDTLLINTPWTGGDTLST